MKQSRGTQHPCVSHRAEERQKAKQNIEQDRDRRTLRVL